MEEPAVLIEKSGDGEPIFHKITTDQFLIGRGTNVKLIISSPQISREHAIIRKTGRQYTIEDLDSRNGTFVNGISVKGVPKQLEENDVIVIGGEVSFLFHDPNETAAGYQVGRINGVWIDDLSREVWVDRLKIKPGLTVQQYALLKLIYSSPGKVFTREEVIAAVWPGIDLIGISEEAVDSVIKRLRARLRENPHNRDYLQVVRGHGIKLVQP